MINRKKYRAFTLLELLISIIIIGIIMSSFPMIFQTMTGAQKGLMKEEVFFEEFSLLSLVNTRYFDENNTVGENFYKDLNATNGAESGDPALLNEYASNYAGEHSRIGKSQFNNNILRSGSSYTLSRIGRDGSGEVLSDTSTLDDIDDFNGYSESFLDYNITVNVKYIDDNATYSDQNITDFRFNYNSSPAVSNIKLITVWCKAGDTNITIRYPASNIGASKFLSLEEISR
ncbi:prepilin-type N-terminal cleavage/methylation domain-containing protein [Nautilia sp.]